MLHCQGFPDFMPLDKGCNRPDHLLERWRYEWLIQGCCGPHVRLTIRWQRRIGDVLMRYE
jgi:hypothetical protein